MTLPHAQAYIDLALGLTVAICIGAGIGLLASLFRHHCPECGREC